MNIKSRVSENPPEERPLIGLKKRIGGLVRWAAWIHLTVVLGLWLAVLAAEPSWWPVALILFAPRWIWALPAVGLLPVALATRPRMGLPLIAAGLLVLWPIMGLRGPRRLDDGEPTAKLVKIRVMTLNQGKLAIDDAAFARLVETIDVVVVQGAKLSDELRRRVFPATQGWHYADGKDGGAEDLVVLSRFPVRLIDRVERAKFGGAGTAAAFDIEIAGGIVRLIDLELPTIRPGLAAIREERLAGIKTFRQVLDEQAKGSKATRTWIGRPDRPLIVVGDFNMTDDSPIYRVVWGDLADAFDRAGSGFGYTRWIKIYGLRLDHILVGPGWRVRSCRVAPSLGPDHLPVIAECEWAGAPEVFPGRIRNEADPRL